MNNKLNKLYNSIGDNELNNQKTTMSLVEEHLKLFNEGKLKVDTYSLFSILGAKNGQGIKAEFKSYDQLAPITARRKAIVDKLLLPLADFKQLVETETAKPKAKTKTEKKKGKEEKKQIVELDYAVNKSNEAIKKNFIRTTANNIVFPICFLASQDKSNYTFKDNKVKVNIKNLSVEVVKSVFGFNKDNAEVSAMQCNLALLTKLAKADLLDVKVNKGQAEEEEVENLEDAVDETTKTEFSEEKADNIVKGISAMLKYLDDNESYDHILQIQNYISDLENYGFETESIVETLRKQSNNTINKDLYGCWVADNSTKLTANTMQELKKQFADKYKIAI